MARKLTQLDHRLVLLLQEAISDCLGFGDSEDQQHIAYKEALSIVEDSASSPSIEWLDKALNSLGFELLLGKQSRP